MHPHLPRILLHTAALGAVSLTGRPLMSQELSLEARAGPHKSELRWEYWNTLPRRSFSGGVGLDLSLGNSLGLRVEAQRLSHGATARGFRLNLDYLAFPLLLRVGPPYRGSGLQVYGLAGVSPYRELGCGGFRGPVSMELVTDYAPPEPPREAIDCLDYRTDGIDVARVLGAGAYLGQGDLRYSIEVRASRGLRNIASEYSCCRLRTRAFSVLGGASWRVPWRLRGRP